MTGLRKGKGRQVVVAFDDHTGEVVAIGTVRALNANDAEEMFFNALADSDAFKFRGSMRILAEKNRWFVQKTSAVRLSQLNGDVLLLNV